MSTAVSYNDSLSTSHRQAQSIYALGSNGSGQLGIGHVEDISTPHRVEIEIGNTSIKRIAAGGNHTLVLLNNGRVLSAGNDEDGRCGHHGSGSIQSMQQIDWFDNDISVTNVAATWSASYFVLQDQLSVLVCGTGEHGELGLGHGVIQATRPQPVVFSSPLDSPILQIAACLSHVVILLANGDIIGWGRGRKGQLGSPNEDVWSPRKVLNVGFSVASIACGVDFTCAIGYPPQHKVLLLGSEGRDRFGLRAKSPEAISDFEAVYASWNSVYILKKTGKLVAWGRDDRGQLPVSTLPDISSFAAGSEHWLAISTEGHVLTAGWSEHGNCGPPTDDFGVVRGRYNHLLVPGRPIKVFAGCATSFIILEAAS